MTADPIKLDLCESSQAGDYAIATVQPSVCININVLPSICSWIQDHGGIHPMSFSNVITLRSAYLHFTNLGFTVTFSHVIGARAYYLGQRPSGNSSTGCTFA